VPVGREEHGGFGEGPCEIRVADLCPRAPVTLACGFFGALDQTAGGDKILDPREALDIVNLIEEHQAQELADARNGAQQVERVAVVLLGRCEDRQLDVAQQLIGEDANIHCPGVEIDPTVCFMLFGVESPEVSSSSLAC
jgi:hypothetical protein